MKAAWSAEGDFPGRAAAGLVAVNLEAVPEPFAMGFAALGIGLVGSLRRRRAR